MMMLMVVVHDVVFITLQVLAHRMGWYASGIPEETSAGAPAEMLKQGTPLMMRLMFLHLQKREHPVSWRLISSE